MQLSRNPSSPSSLSSPKVSFRETVSVETAIKRGRWLIIYPTIIICFTVLITSAALQAQGSLSGVVGPVISYIVSFLLPLLFWSTTITWWRLWAFANVRNVHELRRAAIRQHLIGVEGSIYEKLEFRTPAIKQKWAALQLKFDQPDLFQDDPTVAHQTIIFYSKSKNLFQTLIGISAVAIGVYLVMNSTSIYYGALLILLGIYISYKDLREAFNTTPQIILNENGIETVNTPFQRWADIQGEEVVKEGFGRRRHSYLKYSFPGGNEYLMIDDYNTDMKKLNKLLIIYRGRSNAK